MGCGACVNSKVYTPENIRQIHVKKVCSELRQHSLIKQPQMKRAVSMVAEGSRVIVDPSQPAYPLPQEIRQKWRVMILARSQDFPARPHDSSMDKKHKCIDQISLDIKRTYVGRLSEEQTATLFRILARIASYLPHVGYTQGMNYVVGFFLVCGFEEEQTYWMTVSLLIGRKFLLLGMFEDEFPLAQLYIKIFEARMAQLNPQLIQHIQKSTIPKQAWLFQWNMTWFLYAMNLEQCIQIWDYVLERDGLSIIGLSIAILNQMQEKIMSEPPDHRLYTLLKADNVSTIDVRRLIQRAQCININMKAIQVNNLTEKQLLYHSLLSTHSDKPYQRYLESIWKKRNQYFNN